MYLSVASQRIHDANNVICVEAILHLIMTIIALRVRWDRTTLPLRPRLHYIKHIVDWLYCSGCWFHIGSAHLHISYIFQQDGFPNLQCIISQRTGQILDLNILVSDRNIVSSRLKIPFVRVYTLILSQFNDIERVINAIRYSNHDSKLQLHHGLFIQIYETNYLIYLYYKCLLHILCVMFIKKWQIFMWLPKFTITHFIHIYPAGRIPESSPVSLFIKR